MTSIRLFCLLIIAANVSLTHCFQYSDDDKIVPYSTIRMRRRLYAKRRHRHICNLEDGDRNNDRLKQVIEKSDFVFTGKVVSYYVENETNSIRRFEKRETEKGEKRRRGRKAKADREEENAIEVNFDPREDKSETFVVELKRVMKGGEELSGVDRTVVKVPKEFMSGLEITSDPSLNLNCVEFHPVLKLRSTAILLTRKVNGTKVLELTHFPVAMTLRHLDRVDAAISGRSHFYYLLDFSNTIHHFI